MLCSLASDWKFCLRILPMDCGLLPLLWDGRLPDMRVALCAGRITSHYVFSYIGVLAEALLHEGMMRDRLSSCTCIRSHHVNHGSLNRFPWNPCWRPISAPAPADTLPTLPHHSASLSSRGQLDGPAPGFLKLYALDIARWLLRGSCAASGCCCPPCGLFED